jgi:hypothetical protein
MTNEQEQLAITKYDLFYEARMTKIETISEELKQNVKELKSDLRWIFGITLGFYAITFSVIAKGFHWIS